MPPFSVRPSSGRSVEARSTGCFSPAAWEACTVRRPKSETCSCKAGECMYQIAPIFLGGTEPLVQSRGEFAGYCAKDSGPNHKQMHQKVV